MPLGNLSCRFEPLPYPRSYRWALAQRRRFLKRQSRAERAEKFSNYDGDASTPPGSFPIHQVIHALITTASFIKSTWGAIPASITAPILALNVTRPLWPPKDHELKSHPDMPKKELQRDFRS